MLFVFSLYIILILSQTQEAKDQYITIHLRGVYESKVSLIPMAGKSALKPIIVKDGITKENPEIIIVPDSLLPGEFVLRFDYKRILSFPNTTGQLNESINV